MNNVWPILSLAANVLLALLVFSIRSYVRIAVLELKGELSGTYATKEDLRRVEEKTDLSKQMTDGFARIVRLLPVRDSRNTADAAGGFVDR